jgi:hypothetical protein
VGQVEEKIQESMMVYQVEDSYYYSSEDPLVMELEVDLTSVVEVEHDSRLCWESQREVQEVYLGHYVNLRFEGWVLQVEGDLQEFLQL